MSAAAKVTEDAYAEQPALEWLGQVGWQRVHGPTLASGGAERKLDSDVVLDATFRAAVARLNPDLPPEAIMRACELALTTTHASLIADHQAFHELLLAGVPVSWIDDEHGERSTRARLVDWDEPGNNVLQAVNQLTIVEGGHNRRPDVLLYVNGLPLGQLELKNPSLDEDGPTKAVNQVRHYSKTIPGLYRYVEVVGVSDLLRARVGTITTPPEHFSEWKTMDPAGMQGRSQLEVLITELFTPAGLLDLLRNFVLFQTDGARTWKVMAKYHQVDAVNRAVEATHEAMADRTRRGGVVWHTQGAGKSYSMVFFVTKLRRDRRFANPTIVCVTDTNDLDNQLSETFARQAHLAPVVAQAERIQGGPESLYALLDVPADGIVFTTIQKFARGAEEGPMPVLSQRENVVVIADEAHRSQYAGLARNLMTALPAATRIGFTGTPIESADRSTRAAFGDLISVYRISRAQEDGATVPIFYESRQAPVNVDRAELTAAQAVLDAEGEDAQTELTSEFARMDRVIGAPERLDTVGKDIVAHFTDRCRTFAGQGHGGRLQPAHRRGVRESAEGSPGRGGRRCGDGRHRHRRAAHQRLSQVQAQLKDTEAKFKDPDSPLRVVVVKNMWLTGFDAPVLHTMYIDKPMRDHGLLQAIARVNRVFEGKPGGLVVDYIGIGDDLRAGLTAYAKGDVDDVVVPLEIAQARLGEKHEVMCDLLHGIEFRAPEGATAAQRATILNAAAQDAVARFVLDDERTETFLDEHAQYAKWFSLVSPNEPTVAQRYDHDVFATVAKALRLARAEEEDGARAGPSRAARRAVEQFFSQGLAGSEILDVFAMAGDQRPEISVLSDEFLDDVASRLTRPELQVALMKKLLNGEIRARLAGNRVQHKRFSDEVTAVLARYEARQITSAEVVQELVKLARDLRSQARRHEQLGLSREETAFYDALAAKGDDFVDDPRLKAIAVELVSQVRQDLAVDWTERGNLEARIRARIKRLLRRHRYTAPEGGGDLDAATDRVFQQARTLYERWPEVEDGLV